jgi:hypothetical protein
MLQQPLLLVSVKGHVLMLLPPNPDAINKAKLLHVTAGPVPCLCHRHSRPCSFNLSKAMYAVVMLGSSISPDTISRLNSSSGTRNTWQQQQQTQKWWG